MVVDCGGGTVDVTVHKLHHARGPLKELYKASGEPCGSLGQLSHIKTKKYYVSTKTTEVSDDKLFSGRLVVG